MICSVKNNQLSEILSGFENPAIMEAFNRLLHTKYAMGFEAKSRLTLPNQLPLEWDSFYQAYVKALEPSTKEAA